MDGECLVGHQRRITALNVGSSSATRAALGFFLRERQVSVVGLTEANVEIDKV